MKSTLLILLLSAVSFAQPSPTTDKPTVSKSETVNQKPPTPSSLANGKTKTQFLNSKKMVNTPTFRC